MALALAWPWRYALRVASALKALALALYSVALLVADLADDVNHVCNFAGRDSSLLDNKNEFNKACSSFVEQAGDLGCFKCPSCAKAYISSTWFRRHLGRCSQPTGASTG